MKWKKNKIYNFTPSYILKWRESIVLIGLAIFSFILARYLNGGRYFDWSIPLISQGDATFCSWLIKRLVDGNWYFRNAASGFPFGSDFYDFPFADVGNFLILKGISLFTHNYAYTLNLYYLMSFPVTAIVSFYILRKFQISIIFSLVGSIIFTFLPFHFLRLPHLFYTWYFVIPIFVWFGFKIFSDNPPFFEKHTTLSSKIRNIVSLLILSLFGAYYAVFGTLIFFLAATVASIQKKSKKNIISASIAILIVAAGVGASLLPNLIYKFEHGDNVEVAKRIPLESETYGLKISQLLIPAPYHRFDVLKKSDRYQSRGAFLIRGNLDALGVLGSAGLLILISILLVQRIQDLRLSFLAAVTVFLLLFATIDGFSVLFALFITPMIRGWGRISIFIGFLSIAALMMVFEKYFNTKRFCFRVMGAMVLIVFSIWDQTPHYCKSCLQANKQIFTNDKLFIGKIEKILPANAAIYQLPYMPFPENGSIYNLGDYEHFKGYLHSENLNWSYGGIKGREGDKFFRALSQQPISKQLKVIKQMGFSGVYIDRRGYPDHGMAIEKQLTKILDASPDIISTDGNLSFFYLR